jgi:hypothetical protein
VTQRRNASRRAIARRVLLPAALAGVCCLAIPTLADRSPQVHFGKPVVVDADLAGGEPSVIWDRVHRVFVYTSHEGETHTSPTGLTAPSSYSGTAAQIRNNVNMWTSPDGLHWTRVDVPSTAGAPGTASNAGFSDPDLTQDAGGRIYNTGIDMVNDSLFSSPDGGRTWDKGTANCHEGDRPWLAGGPRDTVFLATNPFESFHSVFASTDGGASCGTTSFIDKNGRGKLRYDAGPNPALHGSLIEPYSTPDGTVGVSILRDAVAAFQSGTGAFVEHPATKSDGFFEHFPAVSLDDQGNVYVVWADQHAGGNAIWLTMSHDGVTWTKPYVVARPGHTVFWPWVAAGSRGNAAVVWWEYGSAGATGPVSVMDANIFGIGTPHLRKYTTNAAGRPIHLGAVCGGDATGCLITGGDRRLGDYFTNTLDAHGCVIIATADTTLTDPSTGAARAWSSPIFLRQDAGPSLTGSTCSAR